MDLMHLVSQISIQMAYYLTLTACVQVVSTYGVIWCRLGHNLEK